MSSLAWNPTGRVDEKCLEEWIARGGEGLVVRGRVEEGTQ